MPLYEFECKKCRNNILAARDTIEKKFDKKILTSILKKYTNIHGIEIYDLNAEKTLAAIGVKDEDSISIDLYIDDGKIMILFHTVSFRFSELILDKEDELKVKAPCCTKGKVEKVISSFSYTQDLSTDPPRPPGMKDLPKGIQGKVQLGEYVEDKDKPHNIKADNRYKHQYTDKGKQKLL
jgi:hypothetical protein|tara:strand:+ start:449 stop:988 length:540 start_codon:yes stop_codon:yes gene_type:complete